MAPVASNPSVLFVCLGNICRSPTGEGVMRHLLAARGLEDAIDVDSAGTGAWHVGNPADPRMRRAAEGRGIPLESLARQAVAEDFDRFDLVIAMDWDNHRDLRRMAREAGRRDPENLFLFSDFLPTDRPRDVPDPYYGGEAGFEEVLDLVEEGCPNILERLLEVP